MAAGWLQLQHRLHSRIEPIETLAHVHRFQGHKHPRGSRETQHGLCKASTTEPIQAGVTAEVNRTANPVGKLTSPAQGLASGRHAANFNSWKPGARGNRVAGLEWRFW